MENSLSIQCAMSQSLYTNYTLSRRTQRPMACRKSDTEYSPLVSRRHIFFNNAWCLTAFFFYFPFARLSISDWVCLRLRLSVVLLDILFIDEKISSTAKLSNFGFVSHVTTYFYFII